MFLLPLFIQEPTDQFYGDRTYRGESRRGMSEPLARPFDASPVRRRQRRQAD